MTNKPATRNSNYEYMLSPVELSETLKELDMTTLQEQFEELKASVATLLAAKPKEPKKEDGLPVSLTADENERIAELTEKRIQLALAEAHSKDAVSTFVAELASGNKDHSVGFNIPAKGLTAFLLRLNETDRKEAQKYLSLMASAAINFAEHGINGEGYVYRPKLPAEHTEAVQIWLEGGKDIKSYFEQLAPELRMEDYNLSEYVKVEEK